MDPTGLNLHCVAFYCLSSSALGADRHIMSDMVDGTGNAGDALDRTVFYTLNMEHAQAESNVHVANATNVDIFGLKVEGSLPVLWVSDSRNVTLFGRAAAPTLSRTDRTTLRTSPRTRRR